MHNFKKEILLIECISSGYMYVPEIIERGYKCLCVQPINNDEHIMMLKKQADEYFSSIYSKEDFECYFIENDADKIIETIKDHLPNVLCVIPGSEAGIQICDEVGAKTNILANNPATTKFRTTKYGMTKALEDAGIRAIKSCKLTCTDDIVKFYTENNIFKSFMKFSQSAAGYGNKECENMQEAIDYYEHIKNMPNYFGNAEDDILLQEFIEGEEYIVNTVSCQGQHILTDIWKYHKIPTITGEIIYNSSFLIHELDEHLEKLVDYVFKVLDVVDLKFGPCHGEFKIDKNGPVLIETNCRPMGGSMTREFLKSLTGNCIVDWSLDSYLNQDAFLQRIQAKAPYKTLRYGMQKYGIIYDECTGDIGPILSIAENLKTFHNHQDYESQGDKLYQPTKDLGDVPYIIKLCGDDVMDVRYDAGIIRKIEKSFPKLLVCENLNSEVAYQPTIQELVDSIAIDDMSAENFDDSTETLVLTDKHYYVVNGSSYNIIDGDINRKFKRVIYANANVVPLRDKFDEIFNLFTYLEEGGEALCSDSVSNMFPYGQTCFAILKKCARV